MNNETLKIDLCARLPYGMKFKYSCPYDHENDRVHTLTEIDLRADCFCDETGSRHKFKSATSKPILFNSLTEPITINGETFVPIVELLKIEHVQWWKEKEGTRYCEIEFSETLNSAKACFSFMATKDITLYTLMPWNYPHWIIEKLNEWHINYRLSPDQFIVATKEYA